MKDSISHPDSPTQVSQFHAILGSSVVPEESPESSSIALRVNSNLDLVKPPMLIKKVSFDSVTVDPEEEDIHCDHEQIATKQEITSTNTPTSTSNPIAEFAQARITTFMNNMQIIADIIIEPFVEGAIYDDEDEEEEEEQDNCQIEQIISEETAALQ